MNTHRSLRAALRTFVCAASTMAVGLLALGCGCGVYDGDGNHMDGSGGSGAGDDGSGGSGGSGAGGDGGGGSTGNLPDACECLSAYTWPSMDAASIRKLADEGLTTCFGSDPVALEQQAACLPMAIGEDAANGRKLQVYYSCSDVCPDAGGVGLAYEDVTDKGTCCSIGGIPIISAGFGSFEACAPAALDDGGPDTCAD